MEKYQLATELNDTIREINELKQIEYNIHKKKKISVFHTRILVLSIVAFAIVGIVVFAIFYGNLKPIDRHIQLQLAIIIMASLAIVVLIIFIVRYSRFISYEKHHYYERIIWPLYYWEKLGFSYNDLDNLDIHCSFSVGRNATETQRLKENFPKSHYDYLEEEIQYIAKKNSKDNLRLIELYRKEENLIKQLEDAATK